MDPTDSPSQPPPQNTQHPHESSSTSSPQTMSSSGPQIRSRITVVCAECKRLKLKCDRRNPCGSCTKRDTVRRCIYSPAAAEKVDLHSLNNRLMQVESTLALITAGQTPPAFISSYPPSASIAQSAAQAHGIPLLSSSINTSSSSSSSSSNPYAFYQNVPHTHHHHFSAFFPPSPSITTPLLKIPIEDLTSSFLADLDLGIPLPSSSRHPITTATTGISAYPQPTYPSVSPSLSAKAFPASSAGRDNGYIKLEPSPVELSQTQTHPAGGSGSSQQPIIIGSDFDTQRYSHDFSPLLYRPHNPQRAPTSSRSSTPDSDASSSSASAIFGQRRRNRRSIGSSFGPQSLRLPPVTLYFASHRGASSSASGSEHAFQDRPRVTQEILSYLPPLPTSLLYLARAEAVLRFKGLTSAHVLFSSSSPASYPHESDQDGIAANWLKQWLSPRSDHHATEYDYGMGMFSRGPLPAFGLDGSGDNAAARGRAADEPTSDCNVGAGMAMRFTGGVAPLPDLDSSTFFTAICALLALGALNCADEAAGTAEASHDEIAEDHCKNAEFLYALSAQAAGLWEGWASSQRKSDSGLDSDRDLGSVEHAYGSFDDASGSKSQIKQEGDDTLRYPGDLVQHEENEDLVHITSLLLQVTFLVAEQGASSQVTKEDGKASSGLTSALFPLLGKLVNSARAIGLSQDSEFCLDEGLWRNPGETEGEATASSKEIAEWKRRIWWDVLFFDLFVSDAFGQAPLINNNSYTTRFPTAYASGFDDISGMQFKSRITGPYEQAPDGSSEEEDLHLTNPQHGPWLYSDARYRLVQLARVIKHRVTYPDCCCGYTLDQATALEGEVYTWLASCGIRTDGSPSSLPINESDVVTALQKSELALWGWKLIMRIWLPFLRAPPSSAGSPAAVHSQPHVYAQSSSRNASLGSAVTSGSWSSHGHPMNAPGTSGHSWTPPFQAMRSTVIAAQQIINAGSTLVDRWQKIASPTVAATTTIEDYPHQHFQFSGGHSYLLAHIFPSLFDFCSLESMALDAVVICAHAGIAGRAMWGVGVMEDVTSGLSLLSDKLRVGRRGDIVSKIVGGLKRRVEIIQGGATVKGVLKRKHDQVDGIGRSGPREGASGSGVMSGDRHDFNHGAELASLGGSLSGDVFTEEPSQVRKLTSHGSPGSTLRTQVDGPSPSTNGSHRSLHSSGSEKDKKHPKKVHTYPPVGIRVRPGKEGVLLAARQRRPSPPSSSLDHAQGHPMSTAVEEGSVHAPQPALTATAAAAVSGISRRSTEDGVSLRNALGAHPYPLPHSRTHTPHQPLTAPLPSRLQETPQHRSRSSSMGQDYRQQHMAETKSQHLASAGQIIDYTSFSGTPSQMDLPAQNGLEGHAHSQPHLIPTPPLFSSSDSRTVTSNSFEPPREYEMDHSSRPSQNPQPYVEHHVQKPPHPSISPTPANLFGGASSGAPSPYASPSMNTGINLMNSSGVQYMTTSTAAHRVPPVFGPASRTTTASPMYMTNTYPQNRFSPVNSAEGMISSATAHPHSMFGKASPCPPMDSLPPPSQPQQSQQMYSQLNAFGSPGEVSNGNMHQSNSATVWSSAPTTLDDASFWDSPSGDYKFYA